MPSKSKKQFLGATALAGLLCCASLPASAESMATVQGNVSPWATKAVKVGTAPADRMVDIAVHMSLRDRAGLKALADSVSKPGNAAYGHYLSKEEVAARFAPDAADVAAVKTILENAGMTAVKVGPAGAYVSARASVAQLRSTFNVTQNLYKHGNATLRANLEEPSIPASLSGKVMFVEGLDDANLLRHPDHRSVIQGKRVAPANVSASRATTAVTPPPVASKLPSPYCSTYFDGAGAVLSTAPSPYTKTLPWLGCGYTPQQIKQAYGLNKVKFNGSGVTVAIIDAYASPTIEADANAYAANHDLLPLTATNFSQIVPVGIYDVNPDEACAPYGWWGEESLDVAAVHGSAPGANIVYIGARDCDTSLTIALENAIYNQLANIITNSYSYNGEASPAMESMQDQDLMVAATQGQSVLFSSGDDGDLSQLNGVATGAYASTSPYATGVGGTSLELRGPGGQKLEVGWGNARDFLGDAMVNSATSVTTSGLETTSNFGYTYDAFAFYAGSGGGISLLEKQPAYQSGIVPDALAETENLATGQTIELRKQRVAPDVAMVADPYTGYLYGESFTIANNAVDDQGCTKTSDTTEYCEGDIGGTSLASPLMAGTLAVVDQARLKAGRPLVGFANPWLYGNKIGATTNSAGINDVLPPAKPEAVLRGYVTNLTEVRVVTLNSVPFVIYTGATNLIACPDKICEGLDDVFNYTTPGYDDVTGLGVPYAPYLVTQ